MAERDLVIGVDSSTTACKVVVWDRAGQVQASGRAALPMLKPRPAWHEQPAEAWWDALRSALREAAAQVDPARLAGMCMATQRETFVVTDAAGSPKGNALLWMDERCRDLLGEIERRYGRERIHAETGKPLSANLSLGKLFWLHENQPELFSGPVRVLDVHALLAGRLTGRFATAWGCADPMGCFDMRANRWNADLIRAIGLRVEMFPEALETGALLGRVTRAAAAECGLPAGLPLFAGIGDGQAAGLGVRANQAGEAYLNLGTAVVSGTYSADYLVDPAFRTMYGGIPGSYALETVLLGGTYTITWFVENFAGLDERQSGAENRAGAAEALLEAEAAKIPPGAQGLTLVPYWNSAMNPYWDAGASGIMVGWRGIHQRGHFYRAILEGIALEQRLATGGVERALGQPVQRLIAVGGGARSRLWRQILADVTGKPIVTAPGGLEASALGAGILAAAGSGLYPGVAEAAQAMTRLEGEATLPDPARQAFYTELYEEVYRRLYPALRGPLDKLADLSSRSV